MKACFRVVVYQIYMNSVATFLMFSGERHGKAEEAIRLYTSLFSNSRILSVERFGPGDPQGEEGTVKVARFLIIGREFMAHDSAIDHNFNFTPSISMFVECESRSELDAAYEVLADGGMTLLPLNNYGFSKRFAWVQDRYGVNWQLNLA